VPIEVLLPLLMWWSWPRLLPAATLRARAPVLALLALHVVFAARDWGHAPWQAPAFAVDPPPMASPQDSVVVLMGSEPQGWRVPSLPASAVYVSLGSNFPASPAYAARVQQMLAARPQRYVMLHATVDRGVARVDRLNAWARRLGWDRQPGCSALRALARRGSRATLDERVPGRCVLTARDRLDLEAADTATRAEAEASLLPLGWRLDAASCQRLPARIGGDSFPYQWCGLVPAR